MQKRHFPENSFWIYLPDFAIASPENLNGCARDVSLLIGEWGLTKVEFSLLIGEWGLAKVDVSLLIGKCELAKVETPNFFDLLSTGDCDLSVIELSDFRSLDDVSFKFLLNDD